MSDKTTTKEKTVKAKPAPKAVKSAAVAKLRIRVRAYESKVLDMSVRQIIDTALRYDAREQFEMRVHKRLIDILNPSAKVIEALTNMSLPSGVTIDVKMM